MLAAAILPPAGVPEHLAPFTWHATDWTRWQGKLAQEAHDFDPAGHSTVLVGDSIMEGWRGTCQGKRDARFDGVPAIRDQIFYRPLILAICNDRCMHVAWRLSQGGELTSAMMAAPQLTLSLMIGANDLLRGAKPHDVAGNITAIAELFLERARGKLLLNALLPLSRTATAWPIPDVALTNALLVSRARELRERYGARVSYVDCGSHFHNASRTRPDGVHPNAVGYAALGPCLDRALHELRRMMVNPISHIFPLSEMEYRSISNRSAHERA